MNCTRASALFFFASLLAATGARAVPLDVKTGLWQSTITSESSGAPPIDLSRFTPEQRARLEAAFQKRAAQGPVTHTYKSCLTKKELEEDPVAEPAERGQTCSTKMTSQTRSVWQGTRVCTGERGRQEYSGKITAVSREKVKGTLLVKMSQGGNTMTNHAKYESKWLGSNCGSVN